LAAILDTFPAFLAYWTEAACKPVDAQMEAWSTDYLSPWPELLAKQIQDYSDQHLDWHAIGRAKVFPHLTERLPAMKDAHQNLLESLEPVSSQAQQRLGFESDVIFVIHVGIGCGAGWVTTFTGRPAILFGLENIAECDWSDPEAIKGLIAHELGHLFHYAWREQAGKSIGSGPWWQLYEEGFAQACESLILNTELVHQANPGKDKDWLEWCLAHKAWLASEFLKTVDSGESITRFFGSWFDICGKSETGYFLGQAVINELEKETGLKEIALLENIAEVARPILEKMTGRK
jgi:hypothetical protein